MRLIVPAALLAALCACTALPVDQEDLRTLGDTEIVYSDMPANLSVYVNGNLDKGVATGVFLFVSMAGSGLLYGVDKHLEHRAESAMQGHDSVTESLHFRETLLARAQAAVQASPWAARVPFHATDYLAEGVSNAEQELLQSGKDSVIFMWPGVYLDDSGQHLTVMMRIVMYLKTNDPEHHRITATVYRTHEFGYSYPLRMHIGPETRSWDQQKQDAETLANMRVEQAMRRWLDDSAAQVRLDFEDARPKIEADLRRFLSAPPAG